MKVDIKTKLKASNFDRDKKDKLSHETFKNNIHDLPSLGKKISQ